jgi:hypothetical protein
MTYAYESGLRIARERLDELADHVDRHRRTSTEGTAKFLATITGDPPSCVPCVAMAYDTQINTDDAENSAPTYVVDSSGAIPVVILNQPAVVGDVLTAKMVGGRWVAWKTGTNCCTEKCLPCPLPRKDLQISWVNALGANGSDTLSYDPYGGGWATGCSGGVGAGNQLIFKLSCTNGSIELRAYYFLSGNCPNGESAYCSNLLPVGSQLVLSSSNCAPLSLEFNVTPTACPELSGSGFTQFTVSDPNPVPLPSPLMCYTFCFTGCNNLPLSNVTVSVFDEQGGTLLASGTTHSIGCVSMEWNGKPGPYYVALAFPDSTTSGSTLSLSCSGSFLVSWIPEGFGCCYGVPDPLPLTLYASVCGVMATLTAVVRDGFIVFWQGAAIVTSPNVAVFTSCDPPSCDWDGVTTITGETVLGIELYCNGTDNPVVATEFLGITHYFNDTNTFSFAFMPSSCPYETLCTSGGATFVGALYYDADCATDVTNTSGTWGSTVSLTSTVGSYLMVCQAANGVCAGEEITITS